MPALNERKSRIDVDADDAYSTDDAVTRQLKRIEAKWWPRERALMHALATVGMLSAYVRATRHHRRRSHSGRTLPHPWHLTEPGGDWWLMFHRTEAAVLVWHNRLLALANARKSVENCAQK